MENAPILISIYTRIDHLRTCINSLKSNDIAKDTVLYIVSDAPSKNEHVEMVDSVRRYLREISGFKEIILIENENNLGSNVSIPKAINFVFESYNKLIFMDDDNYLAPNFLSFVNKGLIAYEQRSDIFSVTGYNSPINMPAYYKNDIYLRRGFAAYGVGLWKEKWNKVDWTMNEFNSFVDSKKEMAKFAKVSEKDLSQLLYMRANNILLVDGVIAVHLLINDMYSIYPVLTRVRNIGHDGSGEHCGTNPQYFNQQLYEKNEDAIFPPDIKPDLKLLNYVQRHYRITFIARLKSKVPEAIRMRLKKLLKH